MKILKLLQNRIFVSVTLILLQIILIFLFMQFIFLDAKALRFCSMIISALVTLYIINKDDDDPNYKIIWLIPILVFPVFGGLLYLVFGNKKPAKKLQEAYRKQDQAVKPYRYFNEVHKTISDEVVRGQVNYIVDEQFPVYKNSEVKYYSLGDNAFPDLLDDTFLRVSSMPKESDIYLTTDTEEKKKLIEEKFKNSTFNHFEVRKIMNRGRDVSSLLVGVKDIIMDYDYVCFAHDKKTAQVKPGTSGASFAYKCFENTLASKDFVYNVIETFENNPRLGLLTPPEPNHGNFFPTLGFEWGPNYDITKKLADELNLTVPISVDKPPVAPFGTMFWFRPKAMEPLYKKDWGYEDFPPEPNKIDGTLLHAIERIYPFIVQESGYYPAIVMNDIFAGIEYNNLKHYVRGYNRVLINHGIGPFYNEMKGEMNYRFIVMAGVKSSFKLLIKNILKKILPQKVGKKLKALYQKVK